MELSDRKKKILAAVIERYIVTGEPVGSKVLCGELAVSSATVRNEMSDLSESGYLEQPHTSAGRIPSQKGIRYYINNLMSHYDVDDSERFAIESKFAFSSGEPEAVLRDAAKLLSDITGCAAVVSTPYDRHTVIKRVELVPLSLKAVLVVVLMSTGVIKSRICRVDSELDMSLVELFYNIVGARFTNRSPSEFTTPMLQTTVAALGDKAFSMIPLIVTLSELATESSARSFIIEGQSKLLGFKDLEPYVYDIFECFKNKNALSRILKTDTEAYNVTLGKESQNRSFENAGIISSGYSVAGRKVGAIGIVGPVRMDYARIIPTIVCISEAVGRVLSEAIEE